MQLQFGGEEVDPTVAPGAVLMEDPPPGSFTIGNQVDVSSPDGTWATANGGRREGVMNFLTCRGEINAASPLQAT